jgi:hypothetical protein
VHPESVLSFYCYADYTQPPTVPRKLDSNMAAMIAPIRYCRLHPIGHPGCVSREQQVAMTDGWAAVASKLGYYNYMYNLADGTLPMFKFSACAKEFPYLADKGLTYMTIEVLSNWHIYGPQIYLSLRLAYDPHADAAAIMEDYWQKFYGPKVTGDKGNENAENGGKGKNTPSPPPSRDKNRAANLKSDNDLGRLSQILRPLPPPNESAHLAQNRHQNFRRQVVQCRHVFPL